jgi:hypothetical protein
LKNSRKTLTYASTNSSWNNFFSDLKREVSDLKGNTTRQKKKWRTDDKSSNSSRKSMKNNLNHKKNTFIDTHSTSKYTPKKIIVTQIRL